jgi:hypothetical protein
VSFNRSRVIWTCACAAAAAAYVLAQPAAIVRRQADFQTALAVTQAHLYGTTGVTARADRSTPRADVLAIVAEGQWDTVRSRVVARGLTIQFEDQRSGYMRVTVPLEDMHLFFEGPEIEAARVDSLGGYDTRLQPQDLPSSLRFSADGTPYPRATQPEVKRPMRPLLTREIARSYPINSDRDMGMTEFRLHNPTFDGRGVVIGVHDGNTWMALDQPEFSQARALDGTPRRKVLRYLDYPAVRREGFSAPFSDWFECRSGICEVLGLTMRLPAAGRYRLAQPMLAGPELGRGRHGFMKYVVLQRQETGRIYIDTDGDLDFLPETPLVDFNSDAWAPRSTATLLYLGGSSFKAVVTIDAEGQFLWVHPFLGEHVTNTSAVAAGSDTGTNLGVGVAPNASLVFVAHGPRAALLSQNLEGTITLARDRIVDVIYAAIVLQTPLGTSDSFDSVAFDRISEAYNKPILISAGNYPFALSTSPASGARVAMTVGQYVSAKSLEARFGVERSEGPVNASPTGPAIDGGPRPHFTAASVRVTAEVCEAGVSLTAQNQYEIPPCYRLSGGTSAASPSAAGIVALLISAARQHGLTPSVHQIREALMASASLMPGIPAHIQGVGLINVQRAWEYLQRTTTATALDIEGELRHPFVRLLGGSRPKGLYWLATSEAKQSMMVTLRAKRAAGIGSVSVRQEGGLVMSVPKAVALGTNGTATVPVVVAPPALGRISSSWLAFLKAGTTDVVARSLVTAARPAPLSAPSFQHAWQEDVEIDSHRDLVVSVPTGATGMLVETELVTGDGRLLITNPWSMPMLRRSFWAASPGLFSLGRVKGERQVGVFLNPAGGTWGFASGDLSAVSAAAGSSVVPKSRVSVRTTAFRTVCDLVARETKELREHIRVKVHDVFARPMNGGVLAAPAVVEHHRFQLKDEFDRKPVTIDVKPETAAFHIEASQTAGDGIVLQLFDCTLGHCIAITQSVPGDESPKLNVRQPTVGIWKVFAVPVSPLYSQTQIDVTVTQALEVNLAPLTQVFAKNSQSSPVSLTFEGGVRPASDARGLMLFRTDERAKIADIGWGAVSLCTIHDAPSNR